MVETLTKAPASGSLRVLQYNVLMEELSSNFIPRTMMDPSTSDLERAFGCGPADVSAHWKALKDKLGNEYRKWHPLKETVLGPDDVEARVRTLWGEPDLLSLEGKGWSLRGLKLSSATQLGEESGLARTLVGMLIEAIGTERGQELYDAIRAVHETSCVWSVRGAKVLKRIEESAADVVVLQEYDEHELPTAGYPTFREAMAALGYHGACFRGPGQPATGVGMFWRSCNLALPEAAVLPETQVIQAGEDLNFAANLDFEEEGLALLDRRHLALVRLRTSSGQGVLLCGVHAMTTSRDKTGQVRAFEIQRMKEFIGKRALTEDAVLLCGDFNIDMRERREEHVWRGRFGDDGPKYDTGFVRPEGVEISRLAWQRADGRKLSLCDAYGDINALAENSTTRTGTRRETIDYIFYDEARLIPLGRSSLRCPEEPMPNAEEPSDHIPLIVDFSFIWTQVKAHGQSADCPGKVLDILETPGSLTLLLQDVLKDGKVDLPSLQNSLPCGNQGTPRRLV